MTNDTDAEDTSTRAPSGPGLSVSERFFARMALAQTITAVVAVLISCAAMYATWEQARASRIQTEAQVWPRLMLYNNQTVDEAGEPVFEVMIANRGIGPAEVRSMRVFRGNENIRQYSDIIGALPEFGRDVRIRRSFINYRIFSPGEESVVIGAAGQDVIEALNEVIAGYTVEICYCSILDQCWLMTDDTSAPVSQCPNHGANEFIN